ncbi:MAG TPA: VOC family protein [Acidimicrobiia bacterium]|jgi:catechol 2,3-dioxygenase-like lactoylglutathione lyase family enzyme|nr:VOC family protein [Acidimicrobiia bacterium]
MRIGQIILRVADLDESVRFWTAAVGFDLTMKAGVFAFVDGGSIQLTLNQVDDRPADGSLTEIVIEVDDVQSAFSDWSKRGVEFEVEPRAVTSDGDRELWATHFHDPDGHLGSVVSWVG